MEKNHLLEQIRAERAVSKTYAGKNHRKWKKHFRLLENERKRDESVGDETMYTVCDSVTSALIEDEINQEFVPTEEADREKCELINACMTHDWNKLKMDEIRDLAYQWTVYTGRVCLDLSQIDVQIKTIKPKFINPFLEYVDPNALSMHGIGVDGDYSARWYGYAIPTTKAAIKKYEGKFAEFSDETTEGVKALRNMSKKEEYRIDIGDNSDATVLVWYTIYEGVKLQVITDVRMEHILEVRDVGRRFPVMDIGIGVGREWYPRSVMDLVADKHERRAEILNTSKALIDEQLSPIYLAKSGFPVGLLEKAESGDVLEVDDVNAVRPLEKSSVSQEAMWILGVLEEQIQESTAMPDIQQGMQMDTKRTASELSIMSSASKRRSGSKARWLGRSWRVFWEFWYEALMEYWDAGTKTKTVEIAGVYGPMHKHINKSDIALENDYDIRIESKSITESKRATRVNGLLEFHKLAVNDPSYQAREGVKLLAKTMGMTTQEINILFPKTTDELEAEEENALLAEGKLLDGDKRVTFDIHQDHDAHIREHMKLGANNETAKMHIEMHMQAKILIKNQRGMLEGLGFAENNQNMEARNATQGQDLYDLPTNPTPLGLPTA